MTVTHINTAPAGIKNQFIDRLWGRTLNAIAPGIPTTDAPADSVTQTQSSLVAAWFAAKAYANQCHFFVDAYEPIFTPIRDRLRAAGEQRALAVFSVAHADELRLEREAERAHKKQEQWIATAPSYHEVVSRNQAAAAADRLEIEIRQLGQQLLRERELAARAQAFTDARMELASRG
jgi:hypothetical protein